MLIVDITNIPSTVCRCKRIACDGLFIKDVPSSIIE